MFINGKKESENNVQTPIKKNCDLAFKSRGKMTEKEEISPKKLAVIMAAVEAYMILEEKHQLNYLQSERNPRKFRAYDNYVKMRACHNYVYIQSKPNPWRDQAFYESTNIRKVWNPRSGLAESQMQRRAYPLLKFHD